jgi:fatty-acyl-CoA synthase
MTHPTPPSDDRADPRHNIASWLEHWCDRRPDAAALVCEGETTSYRTLADRVAQLAGHLRSCGVLPGDRVAIVLANHPVYLEALFACARIGAIALPINTRLAAAEIQFILGDAEPRLILSESKYREVLQQALADERLADVRCLERDAADFGTDLRASAPATAVHPATPDDPVILMYTSGTTGHPKGALLPHRKAHWNSVNAQIAFGTRSEDRVLLVAPLFHSLSLQILSLPVLFCGGCLVVLVRFDPDATLRAIQDERIHYMGGVPTHFERMKPGIANADFDLSSLRFFFTAGAAVNPDMVQTFADAGLVLKQGYGQTETSMLCCLDEADALDHAGSVGRPVKHVTLRVVRRESLLRPTHEWIDCDSDEVGEIVARGAITMLGYWRRPDASAETLRDGWVLTGDLARMDDAGFVHLVGRSREMYISGGENVYPAEIEAAYADHEAIVEIAVVARADAEWSEVGAAYVVVRDGFDLDPGTLDAWGRERLAGYKIPRSFIRIEALPRTASGKIQKHRL